MKTYYYAVLAGLVALGSFTACSDDGMDDGHGTAGTGNIINFTIDGTRTVYDDEDDLQINWVDGDKVRVYCNEAADVKQADYDVVNIVVGEEHNANLAYNANGLAWGSDGAHHFYAVYPADNGKVSVDASTGIATFGVNQNQVCELPEEPDPSTGNYAAIPDMTNAYMVAYATTSSPVNQVSLAFRPIMTTLKVTVRAREGLNTEPVTLTGISIVNNNVTSSDLVQGRFQYDVVNGEMLNTSDQSNAPTTEITYVGVHHGDNSFIDLEGGQSVTLTAFLPPLPIGGENPVLLRVHATGETTLAVTLGDNAGTNNPSVSIPASSKSSITLPYYPTVQNGNNWITPLDDDIYVSQLSIPGTHDAATGDGTVFSIGQSQEIDLNTQFEMGIRCFDLRPAVSALGLGDDIWIYHGSVATSYTWDGIMDRFKYYLQQNPGEFIIIIMRHEDEADRLDLRDRWGSIMVEKLNAIKNTINPATGESYAIDFKPDLTVGEMRGKILFLCRDWTPYADSPTVGGYMGWSHEPNGAEVDIYGPDGATGILNIQDCYSPSVDGTSTILNASQYPIIKWNSINALLAKSRTFHTDASMACRWSINHTSGYTEWIPTTEGYRHNASNNNVPLYLYLNSEEWNTNPGSTGIMIMDFVGSRISGTLVVYGDLMPQAIIDNNYKYRMVRKGE